MADETIRSLPTFNVEYTRLDEKVVTSFLVAVNPGADEAEAIRKGDILFAGAYPDAVLVPFTDVVDPSKREGMDRLVTFWRNKVQLVHSIAY